MKAIYIVIIILSAIFAAIKNIITAIPYSIISAYELISNIDDIIEVVKNMEKSETIEITPEEEKKLEELLNNIMSKNGN